MKSKTFGVQVDWQFVHDGSWKVTAPNVQGTAAIYRYNLHHSTHPLYE